ncbi:MAG: hypothetical protein Kow0076_6630 [Francisella sp.]
MLPPSSLITRGFGLYIIAFMMIPIGILLGNKETGIVKVIFPVLLMLIVSASEVHINATILSLVVDLIKTTHQGIFIGYIYINAALGIILSGPVSNYAIVNKISANDITALGTNPIYFNIFISLTMISAVLTIVFFFISKKINKVFKNNY